jgi:signal transduction histidine kinase
MREVARAVDLLTADEHAMGAVAEVLDAVGITAFVVGVDSPVRWAAPSWETVYGGSCEDFGRRRSELLRLVHPDEREAIADLLGDACQLVLTGPDEARPVLRRDVRLRLLDGTYRWTELSLHLLRTDSGTQIVFGLLHDASRLHDAERDLVAMAEAEVEANRATAEFVSKMSHELRTPLHAILGYAQLLEMGAGDPADYLQRLRRAGDHLVHLLDDLLDVSRLSAGRLAVADDAVDLDSVIQVAVDVAGTQAGARDVRIDWERGPSCVVRGDATRLRQVLTNLLTNAVKYNRLGGVVRITCAASDSMVEVAVADAGPGIAPELLDRLFIPFDRLGAEHGEVPGVGLGLPLAHGLVLAMGGRLTLDSAPGAGTTARVSLRRDHPGEP